MRTPSPPVLRWHTHEEEEKGKARWDNGKPSGRAGLLCRQRIRKVATKSRRCFWQMGKRGPIDPAGPNPAPPPLSRAAFSGKNFGFMHCTVGPTQSFLPFHPVLWNMNSLAKLDPCSSLLSSKSDIPITCSWGTSEISPPPNSLKPTFENILDNHNCCRPFQLPASQIEIANLKWNIIASCSSSPVTCPSSVEYGWAAVKSRDGAGTEGRTTGRRRSGITVNPSCRVGPAGPGAQTLSGSSADNQLGSLLAGVTGQLRCQRV